MWLVGQSSAFSMRILVASFFPAFYPPRSGGEQRLYYLYSHLSGHFDVTLLSPTYSTHVSEIVTHSATFREHRVPKDPVCDQLHRKLSESGIGPECSAYVVALAGGIETEFGRRFQALVRDHDLIIHESPFTLPYDLTASVDGKPRIYNSYNVESLLAAEMLRGEAGRKATDFIRFLEQSMVADSSLVFATCEDERQVFVAEFGIDPKCTALAPNGFEPPATEATESLAWTVFDVSTPYALFMGSAHPPNIEAALFVVEHVAPALPELEFRLMGAVCDHLPEALPRNVRSLGFLEESDKRRQLEGCAAALNPMFSGAGTNLKMLDYMATGAPIVTTPIGARGLDLKHGVDAFLSEARDYAESLRTVVRAPGAAKAAGVAAKQKAFAEYTWARIAERVRDDIQSVPARTARVSSAGAAARQLLLVVNDFSVAHATGGGQVRIRELLTELGREFDVVLLCLTPEPYRRELRVAPGFTEVKIPKTSEHRGAETRARCEGPVSVDDLVAAEYCARNVEFIATFRRYADQAAAVVFEHPYIAPLIDCVPTGTPIVYSSLNVESDLKAATLRRRPDAVRRIADVIELEDVLLGRADLVVCVSQHDRQRFRETHPDRRYEVIPSGARADLPETPAHRRLFADGDRLRGRAFAAFIGSAHMPNIAAAQFLIDMIAPDVPEVTFAVIGSVCDAVKALRRPRNVLLFGLLGEAEKNVLLAQATLAINPLFEGGGSSLKVPDFFAAGLPLVSTRVGVRGYDVVDGEHFLAAEPANFAPLVRRLASDEGLRHRLARNAHEFWQTHLDWRVLGAQYRRVLRSVVAPKARPRVLVATYRFADPPPGGAEAFLVNVLRELSRRGVLEIEVATCDVGTITNTWHFSAQYSKAERPASDPAYVGAIHRFGVDPGRVGDFERCRRLFSLWMAESRTQAMALPEHFDHPLLLGGWNYPETSDDKVVRWASRDSQIFVGQRSTAMRIAGFAPQDVTIEVVRGGKVVGSRVVSGRFEWRIDLPGDDPIVSLRAARTFVATEDPRELSILVEEATLCEDSASVAVDLREDFASTVRRRAPELWVKSLIEVAERRDPCEDDLFIAVRGPHSKEFRCWLEDNVASYDVVLAQGVPFATPVEVTDIATRQGVPVVVLPHFHMEDTYYHWRRYYDVFRRAWCVIASSRGVKSLVFDALGANSVVLPGGGVDLGEYDKALLPARQEAFRKLHGSSKPFVLVLGRKAGSKHYQLAIDAIAAINRDRHRVDLILIGPDDDGSVVTAPNTFYYGMQERDVVLGALSLSLCLVNMSDSESFGIVLLESWLSGRPVVAQRKCLAFADLVVPGENGFLAESPAEIGRAIEFYLADPASAVEHGNCGKALAEGYSWSHLAERIESLLMDARTDSA
jgi:glycosyltransferase involved in cell wall biosynthesis